MSAKCFKFVARSSGDLEGMDAQVKINSCSDYALMTLSILKIETR